MIPHRTPLLAAPVATAIRTARNIALTLGLFLSTMSCASTSHDVRYANSNHHRTAYRVLGAGELAIVMISGLGDGMATFDDVASELATRATVILYNRAGYGESDGIPGARDAEAASQELAAVLEQSGVRGPYVLVGHSVGGLYAEYFAAQHPDKVLGLVLAESRPADFTRRCEDAGISACTFPPSLTWTLPAGGRAEFAALPMTSNEVEHIQPYAKPVLVLSRPAGAAPSAFDALWSTAQRDLAARYPGARQLVAQAGGHYLHVDQRDWFIASVLSFIDQARAQPVRTDEAQP